MEVILGLIRSRRRFTSFSLRPSRRRSVRPCLDALESRELLSTTKVPKLHALAQPAPIAPYVHPVPFGFPFYQYGFPFPKARGPIIPQLPATPTVSATTIPANGDVNPYGVAIVPTNGYFFNGLLRPGDVLVSNFNNNTNVQGTGTTIVKVNPNGHTSLFYTSPVPGVGLPLAVLSDGFVVVGNAPTPDATLAHMGKGEIQFIDRFGHSVLTLTDPNLINGPWGSAVNDHGVLDQLFVSNALTGAITRIDVRVMPGLDQVQLMGMTQIASGYTVTPSAAAVVLAPAGLAYDPSTDSLYVASTGDNAIYSVSHASRTFTDSGRGSLVIADPAHLNGPIGLALTTNGHILTTNGDAFSATPPATLPTSALVEYTTASQFVALRSLDPNAGAAFGVALRNDFGRVTLVTVNDSLNNLNLWTIPSPRPRHGLGWWL